MWQPVADASGEILLAGLLTTGVIDAIVYNGEEASMPGMSENNRVGLATSTPENWHCQPATVAEEASPKADLSSGNCQMLAGTPW